MGLKGKSKQKRKSVAQLFDEDFHEYIRYLKSPWHLFIKNFLVGVSRGLGMIIGMTLVMAVVTYIVARLIAVPLVGDFFEKVHKSLTKYTTTTTSEEVSSRMLK